MADPTTGPAARTEHLPSAATAATDAPAGPRTVLMLASDLDGTLLRSDNTVSQRTREAMAAAEQAGFVVAFVTGRPPRWLHEVADATGHTGVAVAANGALLYDLHTEQIVERYPIEDTVLRQVAAAIRERIPGVRFGVEYGTNFGYEAAYNDHWDSRALFDSRGRPVPEAVQRELAELFDEPTFKVLVKHDSAPAIEFMDTVEQVAGDLVTITRSSSAALVEISATGITKASGLAALAKRYRVEQGQVAAVGDMLNDLPMLGWAGHSFAVANAHPDVRRAADHLLVSNDEDAVAILLEALIEGRFPED